MKKRTVVLMYPPVGSVWHLPMGIALLTAVLQEQGHFVTQRYGHILGVEDILRCYDRAGLEAVLATIRSSEVSIIERYSARMWLEEASAQTETHGDTFRVERNNVVYVSEGLRTSHDDIQAALTAIENRRKHLFYPYFQAELLLLDSLQPDMYGISVDTERNVIPALILAAMVKEAQPKTLVVLGGNFWPRVLDETTAQQFTPLFQWVDAIVYAEGFQPLAELADSLDAKTVSGTAWNDRGVVRLNPRTSSPTHFHSLPVPVFDTSVRQWSPEMVPPVFTSAACPSACGFCAISAASDSFLGKARMMPPSTVADQMLELHQRHGVTRFDVVDETFTVGQQLALGRELVKRGFSATWQCYLTITNQLLDKEKCAQLYAAGCRAVQLGLESLSSETLDRENKRWNTPENYAQILRNLREAGIQTHVFLIVGIPGEPIQWAAQWPEFLREHGRNILTIKAGRYRLTRRSPEEMYGTHHALIEPLPDAGRVLHLNRDFQYRDEGSGRSIRKDVEAARDLVEQACREHWAYEVTSTLPWWITRGDYTWEQLEEQSVILRTTGVKTPKVSHIADARRRLSRV